MDRGVHFFFQQRAILRVLLFALFVLPHICFGQDATNLVKNGDFAKGKAPWKGVGRVKPGMLEVPLNSGHHQEFSQTFNNKALAKKFTVSFKIKTSDDFEVVADERLDLMDRKLMAHVMVGKTGSGSFADVAKTSEWRTISLVVGISPPDKKTDLVIYVPRGKGTLYFTDFELRVSP